MGSGLPGGRSRSHRGEAALVILAFGILLTVFFWKPLILGYKLLPSDIIFRDPFFSEHAPPGFLKPHNNLLYDETYQFFPWRVHVKEAMSQGQLPLWNPYIFCGTPFLAKDQPAVFDPINLFSLAFETVDAVLVVAILRIVVAGLGTYLLVRALGGGRIGAFVSAVSYGFGGFIIVWLAHPHSGVAAWLPWFLLTIEWLVRRLRGREVAQVAMTIALLLFAGHAETALYGLVAGGLFFLLRAYQVWQGHRQGRQTSWLLVSFVAAVGLGFCLASVHIWPFWQWLQRSAEWSLRIGSQNLDETRLGLRAQLPLLLTTVLPNVLNNPTWPYPYRSFVPDSNLAEQALYVGVTSLVLAAVAVARRRRDGVIVFLAALAVGSLGAALRLPVFDWINHLPLFSMAAYGRFRLVYSLAAAVLAGMGVTVLLNEAPGSVLVGRTARWLLGLALASSLGLVGARWALEAMAAESATGKLGRIPFTNILPVLTITNLELYWPVLVAVAAGAALWLYGKGRVDRRVIGVILILLTVVDLFGFGIGYHSVTSREWVYPKTPAMGFLQADDGLHRLVGMNVDLMPNTSMVYGLYDVRGLDFPERRYLEFCQGIGGRDWMGYGILFMNQPEARVLGLMNVKYLISSVALTDDALLDLRLAYTDGQISVYENTHCLPRAFVVHRVRVMPDTPDILRVLQDPGFDLANEITLEQALPVTLADTPAGVARDSVEITRYGIGSVSVAANLQSDGLVFLSDRFDPSWRAYVDGTESPVYRADYAFRAVYVPRGVHKVEFVYEPEGFAIAMVVSLLALAVIASLMVAPHLVKARTAHMSSREG